MGPEEEAVTEEVVRLGWPTHVRCRGLGGAEAAFTTRLEPFGMGPHGIAGSGAHGGGPANGRGPAASAWAWAAARALGFAGHAIAKATQVHGVGVKAISAAAGWGRPDGVTAPGPGRTGSGGPSGLLELGECDSAVCDVPGVALMTLHADCAPVYLYDARRHAMGLAHSGWKGTAGSVAVKAAEAMSAAFGTDAGDLCAYVGPYIKGCCYEVGDAVASAMAKDWAPAPGIRSRDGRLTVDLGEVIRRDLVGVGVDRRRICVSGLCTSCGEGLFHSHRRDGAGAGRMAAFMWLRERPAH